MGFMWGRLNERERQEVCNAVNILMMQVPPAIDPRSSYGFFLHKGRTVIGLWIDGVQEPVFVDPRDLLSAVRPKVRSGKGDSV
jgi:hypothetical protein